METARSKTLSYSFMNSNEQHAGKTESMCDDFDDSSDFEDYGDANTGFHGQTSFDMRFLWHSTFGVAFMTVAATRKRPGSWRLRASEATLAIAHRNVHQPGRLRVTAHPADSNSER
jgi:hypothetical protein